MSEYQFYEFRSIDKPLTETEMDEIASWSSRTDPTPHGAAFVYNYGNFGRDELKVVEQYFDALFYISNWGSARLVFKFPRDLLDLEAVGRYCMFEEIENHKNRKREVEQRRKETERLERLSKLARNEKALWEKANQLISQKKSSAYDDAVKILTDLKTLAVHRDSLAEYEGKIRNILEQYSRLSSLKNKLRIAGLVG